MNVVYYMMNDKKRFAQGQGMLLVSKRDKNDYMQCVCVFAMNMIWGMYKGAINRPIHPFSLRTSVKSSAVWLSGMWMLNSERLLVDLVQILLIALVLLMLI